MIKRTCATIVLLVMSCGYAHAAEKTLRDFQASFVAAATPSPVPDLPFTGEAGQEHRLRDLLHGALTNRYVLLNIWATWCAPCREEMPSLDALQARMESKNLTVIALAQDREGPPRVSAYFRRYKLTHLNVYADTHSRAIRTLGLRGLPTSLLIDPQGFEIGRFKTPIDWTRPDNLAALERLISSKNGSNNGRAFPSPSTMLTPSR